MEDTNKSYRTLHLLVKYGDWLAPVVAIGALVFGAAVLIAYGLNWAIAVWIIVAAFLYLMTRSFIELVRLIVDMLLPK